MAHEDQNSREVKKSRIYAAIDKMNRSELEDFVANTLSYYLSDVQLDEELDDGKNDA